MKPLIYILIVFQFTLNCTAQDNSRYKYSGIDNNTRIDPDFSKGSDKIKNSILLNLNNLNLYEYSHALPELYELVDQGKIDIKRWKNFIDSLELEVSKYMKDTVQAYWAVDYLGLIPLQTDFFLASLDKSKALNKKYPKSYTLLKNNTSRMEGLGYKEDYYDSLVKSSDVRGETTFWYFFQLESCNITKLLSENFTKEKLLFLVGTNELISTYKIPYYLQKRKWQSIQRRLDSSKDNFCTQLSRKMNSRTISIQDNNKDFFKNGLEEGVNRDKVKEF